MLDGAARLESWEPFCFFLTSVGYTIGWTAVSSMLASFKRQFGPAVLLQLNMAYFLPSIPVLFLQTQYDAAFNRRYGLPQAVSVRMVAGLGGAALTCAVLPFLEPRLSTLLWLTALLGLCCGVAFGSSYQLVSHFSDKCNVALTIGFVGSGPIVLLLEIADKVGPRPTQLQRILLYTIIVPFFTLLGLAGVLSLLRWHWDALQRAGRRAAAGPKGGPDEGEALLETAASGPSTASPSPATSEVGDAAAEDAGRARAELSGSAASHRHGRHHFDGIANNGPLQVPPSKESPEAPSTWQLLADVWPAALALSVSVGCATLVFPFFTYCPSDGWLGDRLPQALFFARTLSDIVGRFLPHAALRLDTRRGLHAATAAKLAAVPLGFWYVSRGGGRSVPRSDAAALAYVSLFWLQSGAVNSAAFVSAAAWASPGLRERAGGLLALAFQASCLVALAAAYAVQRYCEPFRSDWT